MLDPATQSLWTTNDNQQANVDQMILKMKTNSYNLELTNTKQGHHNQAYQGEEPELVKEPNGNLAAKASDQSQEIGRDTWDKPIEFLLSCIAMSVGLGNVWRFPFTAYENGGGAFLIPYLIVLFFIGKPLYFLEMSMGQFSSCGQVKVWKMAPIFKGVGYSSMVGTACVVSYYVSLMAITVYYFFASFSSTLPWTQCDPGWGQGLCNGTAVNPETNKTVSELYFEHEVFPQYENINNGIGFPHWKLTLCLVTSWILIFLSVVKGVQSSGKVAYFTALFPYLVLFVLLIRGVTLNGAGKGIYKFIVPEWKKILEPEVWYAAVGQCFFSLSTGFGPIIMFSSYNPFRHNVYRDALIISLLDTFTSLLAGFTIFGILGNLATESGLEIEDVVKSGPGLAFISYPDAIAKFDWVPQLFAVLFFLMLFTLGLGSATSLTGGLITIACDQWPHFRKSYVTAAVCLGGLFAGLIYVTPGGQFMLTLVDYFGASFVVFVIATLEVIGVAWCYGLNKFCRDIEFMLEIKIGFYWKFCWGFFVPVGLIIILFYSLITSKQLMHNNTPFPPEAIAAGWTLSAIALALIPICAVHSVHTRKAKGFLEKFKEAFLPSADWGPQQPQIRKEWNQFTENNQQD